MKISYLPIIVVAIALSFASVNAMPDLGRETGKFIQNEEPAPKGVRTFEPAKLENPQASQDVLLPWRSAITGQRLSVLLPWRSGQSEQGLSVLLPWRSGQSEQGLSVLLPWRSGQSGQHLAVLLPWRSKSQHA
jgi:hypothetical protein